MNKTKFIALLFLLSFLAINESKAQGLMKTIISLTGSVFNEVTKQPETCSIMVFDADGNRVTATRSNAAENGNYYLTSLQPGKTYKVHLKKKGFMDGVWEMALPEAAQYQELSKDFLIKPLEANILIPFSVSPFEYNKSKLRFGAEIILDEWVDALKANPNVKFEINCYPDNDNNASNNKTLTEEREASLMNFLVAQGISADRVNKGTGQGKTDPKNPPPTKLLAKGKRYIGSSYVKILSF